MRLSKRGEYGLRAMMTLAGPGPDDKPPTVQIHGDRGARADTCEVP